MGWEGGQVACLLWLALLLFPSSLPCALRAHGAVGRCRGWRGRCRGWRGRLLWTLCICLRFMTMIWNDNDYLSERMRDWAEIGDV